MATSESHPAVLEPTALRGERSLGDQLSFLRGAVGLKDRELALVADVNVATIRRWRKKGGAERNQGLDDLRQIVVVLLEGRVLEPLYIGAWLRSRNRALANQRPLDVLRDPHKFEVVVLAAEAAISGLMPARPMSRAEAEDEADDTTLERADSAGFSLPREESAAWLVRSRADRES